MGFRPLRAAKCTDPKKIKYPVYMNPKVDGIRCIVLDKVPYTRTMKPIPNKYIRQMLSGLKDFDGELVVRDAKGNIAIFDKTQSAVMTQTGNPEFEYLVFDVPDPMLRNRDFQERMNRTEVRAWHAPKWVKFLNYIVAHNYKELMAFEARCVAEGYEGIMVRSFKGPYKEGSSTLREGYLMKIKRKHDAEATIIGYKERKTNTNEKVKNELGLSKRSSKKAGMVPAGDLGAWICRDKKGREFDVGSGMTALQRKKFWRQPDKYVGQYVTYEFQELTKDGAPRFPIFKAIRDKRDVLDD